MRVKLEDGGGGLLGWSLRDFLSAELDGLPTERSEAPPPEPADHPNGAARIDHVVVSSADLGRSTAALKAAGLPLRRISESQESPGGRCARRSSGWER